MERLENLDHDLTDLLHLLERLEGCNANEKVDTLIRACLDKGIREGPKIVATLVCLDFNRKHAGARLAYGCGNNAERFDWRKEPDGTYASNT